MAFGGNVSAEFDRVAENHGRSPGLHQPNQIIGHSGCKPLDESIELLQPVGRMDGLVSRPPRQGLKDIT